MATERQIAANRANAAKSTGPVTPEGKRISSRNAARSIIAGTVVLKGESTRRFNQLADALTHQLQPRNVAETGLVQVMLAARWRLLRMWGIQTAAFELEMARARQNADPSTLPCGAVLAAIAFRAMADTSKALVLQLRLEADYHRQFNQALSMLLKLRAMPDTSAASEPLLNLTTETWNDDDLLDDNPAGDDPKDEDLTNKPNSEPAPQAEPAVETTRCHHNPRRRPSSSEPNSRACHHGALPRQPPASSKVAHHGSARSEVETPPGSSPAAPRHGNPRCGIATARITMAAGSAPSSLPRRQKHP